MKEKFVGDISCPYGSDYGMSIVKVSHKARTRRPFPPLEKLKAADMKRIHSEVEALSAFMELGELDLKYC
jgi:hypothetical protein